MAQTSKKNVWLKDHRPSLWWLGLGLLAVIAIWGTSGWLLYEHKTEEGLIGNRGTFGDMFGAVNALFSGLAFAALIYTVWMQRIELALQREELSDTRAVLEDQKREFEAQNKTLRQQSFENTFFELVRARAQLVGGVTAVNHHTGQLEHGQAAFSRHAGALINGLTGALPNIPDDAAIRHLRHVYDSVFETSEAGLAPYFRHHYHIFKFIDSSTVENKQQYASFVRAQLSTSEAILLCLNCLTQRGAPFKPLIEKYSLLKHLGRTSVHLDRHRSRFTPGAFGVEQ